MPRERSPLPDQRILLRQQGRHLATNKLVADGLLAVRVQLAGVADLPGAARLGHVIGLGLARGRQLGALVVEGVAVKVLLAAHGRFAGDRIRHEHRIVGPVDVGVDAQAEKMLVVVGVDAGIYLGAPAVRVLVGIHGVRVEDARQLDLGLDGAVLVEGPGDHVLVVGGREDLLDDELAAPRDDDAVVAEVGVLEQDTRVLLVDADGVLDLAHAAHARRELGVQVVDRALAVAPQRQAVGHVAGAVLALVKRVLALVRVLWVSVGDDHFGQGEAVEDGPHVALVVEGDVVEHDALAVVEADVELPVLPLDLPAVELEGDALGLGDVDGLQVIAEAAPGLDGSRVVVESGSLAEWPADLGNVDGDNLLLVGIVDGAEVKRILVLAVVELGTVVHERLLQSYVAAETLVVTDCPRVTVHLVHVLLWDAADLALLDDLRVLADNVFHKLQLFHGNLVLVVSHR